MLVLHCNISEERVAEMGLHPSRELKISRTTRKSGSGQKLVERLKKISFPLVLETVHRITDS